MKKYYVTVRDAIDCERCDGTGFMDSFDPEDGMLDSVIQCNAENCENGLIYGEEFQVLISDLFAFAKKE